jgi:hypothetical protein
MADLRVSRALVDLQANARLLYELVVRHDPEAKRIVNLILQDAYVVKDSLYGHEPTQSGHVDAYGSDRCKASPMIYAHLNF